MHESSLPSERRAAFVSDLDRRSVTLEGSRLQKPRVGTRDWGYSRADRPRGCTPVPSQAIPTPCRKIRPCARRRRGRRRRGRARQRRPSAIQGHFPQRRLHDPGVRGSRTSALLSQDGDRGATHHVDGPSQGAAVAGVYTKDVAETKAQQVMDAARGERNASASDDGARVNANQSRSRNRTHLAQNEGGAERHEYFTLEHLLYALTSPRR